MLEIQIVDIEEGTPLTGLGYHAGPHRVISCLAGRIRLQGPNGSWEKIMVPRNFHVFKEDDEGLVVESLNETSRVQFYIDKAEEE